MSACYTVILLSCFAVASGSLLFQHIIIKRQTQQLCDAANLRYNNAVAAREATRTLLAQASTEVQSKGTDVARWNQEVAASTTLITQRTTAATTALNALTPRPAIATLANVDTVLANIVAARAAVAALREALVAKSNLDSKLAIANAEQSAAVAKQNSYRTLLTAQQAQVTSLLAAQTTACRITGTPSTGVTSTEQCGACMALAADCAFLSLVSDVTKNSLCLTGQVCCVARTTG